ncbi:hypothetical protein Bhyg_10308, partial [Pseudolycoriella hygida]
QHPPSIIHSTAPIAPTPNAASTLQANSIPKVEITAYKKFATQYRPHMLHTKFEICEQLKLRTHPLFTLFGWRNQSHNLMDQCPLSGHLYEEPLYTNTWVAYLIPVGEWKVDFNHTKTINGSEEQLFTTTAYFISLTHSLYGESWQQDVAARQINSLTCRDF